VLEILLAVASFNILHFVLKFLVRAIPAVAAVYRKPLLVVGALIMIVVSATTVQAHVVMW